jgi:preprotein translocase subunit SecD
VARPWSSWQEKVQKNKSFSLCDRRLAIVIDQTVYSAPVIREKISGGTARITGKFDEKEAVDLALLFRSGPLPAKIELVEHKTLKKELWLGSTNEVQE